MWQRVSRGLGNRCSLIARTLTGPAMVRPVVILQSDDWGRVGIPNRDALDELKSAGYPVGQSTWDYCGLETADDILNLGETLSRFRDVDGSAACFTANFIMANADLRSMVATKFKEFLWRPIAEGFPPPWDDKLMPAYKYNIAAGVFFPGLHGFSHFNIPELLAALADAGERGHRARALAALDVPYLRSVTPEYNFALVGLDADGEHFLSATDQERWVQRSVELFEEAFGVRPMTACAPGYRHNCVTLNLLRRFGVSAIQSMSHDVAHVIHDLLMLGRNVSFEPVLTRGAGQSVIEKALRESERAVAAGLPVIMCSHSINYISRFVGRADQGREALARFLGQLMHRFPELRFASDNTFFEAWSRRDSNWVRAPSASQITARARLTLF
jgi:hypothetical protein